MSSGFRVIGRLGIVSALLVVLPAACTGRVILDETTADPPSGARNVHTTVSVGISAGNGAGAGGAGHAGVGGEAGEDAAGAGGAD